MKAAVRAAALVARHGRGFAASAEAAVVEADPFLRFATPIPAPYNFTAALSSVPDTKVTRLPSGLRVTTQTIPFAETATVGVYIDAGSRYETDASNGTAHFLEHMAFKGTKKRNQTQLEVEIEDLGASLNAYTSREQTCYFAKVLKSDVPKAVDILSDILQNSHLSPSSLERERSVILREMEEVENIPEEVVFDHLHATAFQGTPLARTILGPAENIRSITREHLVEYIAKNYTAPRMVVSAAGAVDHDEVVQLAEKAFSGLSSDPTTATDLITAEPSYFTGSDVRVRDPDLPTLQFAVAWKGAAYSDPDSVPLMVMQQMLGAWNKASGVDDTAASRAPHALQTVCQDVVSAMVALTVMPALAQLCADNELCNSFMTFNTNYHDTGLWGVYAVADKDSAMDDLAWAIMQEVTKLVYEVTEDDVTRAKNQLKAMQLFGIGNTGGAAEELGRHQLAYGRRVSKAELFARIDAVDADTVKAVAERFLYDQDVAIAAYGPTQGLPDYNWFRRRTYWLRY